jgi:hypothetical protein
MKWTMTGQDPHTTDIMAGVLPVTHPLANEKLIPLQQTGKMTILCCLEKNHTSTGYA